MEVDAVELEPNSLPDGDISEGDGQTHVPDASDHANASLKCLETLTHLIREGSKWWAFKHWAELLPGRKSLENNAKRALMERQAIEILKITKPGERQLDQLEFLSRYLKHCAKKFFSQVSGPKKIKGLPFGIHGEIVGQIKGEDTFEGLLYLLFNRIE